MSSAFRQFSPLLSAGLPLWLQVKWAHARLNQSNVSPSRLAAVVELPNYVLMRTIAHTCTGYDPRALRLVKLVIGDIRAVLAFRRNATTLLDLTDTWSQTNLTAAGAGSLEQARDAAICVRRDSRLVEAEFREGLSCHHGLALIRQYVAMVEAVHSLLELNQQKQAAITT